jgi:hypothetical protein
MNEGESDCHASDRESFQIAKRIPHGRRQIDFSCFRGAVWALRMDETSIPLAVSLPEMESWIFNSYHEDWVPAA